MGPKDGFLWDPFLFSRLSLRKWQSFYNLSCVISNQARKMEKFTTLVKVMLPVLPVVGLVVQVI